MNGQMAGEKKMREAEEMWIFFTQFISIFILG